MEINNSSSSHAVYNIKLHIVFVTKYRRKTLAPELLDYLKSAFADVLAAWRCALIEFGGESDHVHLLVDIHPALDISVLITTSRPPAHAARETASSNTWHRSTASRCSGTGRISSAASAARRWKRCALMLTHREPKRMRARSKNRQKPNRPLAPLLAKFFPVPELLSQFVWSASPWCYCVTARPGRGMRGQVIHPALNFICRPPAPKPFLPGHPSAGLDRRPARPARPPARPAPSWPRAQAGGAAAPAPQPEAASTSRQ